HAARGDRSGRGGVPRRRLDPGRGARRPPAYPAAHDRGTPPHSPLAGFRHGGTEARRHGGSGVARGWGKIARSRRWSLALRCAAMNEAPIFRFNSQRQRLVESTIDRSVETIRDPLIVLNDAAFHETR